MPAAVPRCWRWSASSTPWRTRRPRRPPCCPTAATHQQADDIRLDLRQRKSVPILEKIKAWLDTESKLVLPRSPMAEAINYTLNQWQALCVYTGTAS